MRVFISSTSEDLEAYRAAARDVVLHLEWQVVMMEYFGTDGTASVVEACSKKVGEADVVLAILGWRRGGVPGTERGGNWHRAYAYTAWLGGRLPTEAEWEYAARAGCPHPYCDRQGNETTLDKVG